MVGPYLPAPKGTWINRRSRVGRPNGRTTFLNETENVEVQQLCYGSWLLASWVGGVRSGPHESWSEEGRVTTNRGANAGDLRRRPAESAAMSRKRSHHAADQLTLAATHNLFWQHDAETGSPLLRFFTWMNELLPT